MSVKEFADCLMNEWNASGMIPIRNMSPNRIIALRARMKDSFWVENYGEAIFRCFQSSFCNGKNGRGWRGNIDWFLQPGTVAKILEGQYDDRKPIVCDHRNKSCL